MPNKHYWSASMVLEWVLSRDTEKVLSMADEYGAVSVDVDKDSTRRVQPPTWDDVSRAHAIDESLPEGQRLREGVKRASQLVIPARQTIIDALQNGEIESWAQPNGSGNMMEIKPAEWSNLRLRAVAGHDIAVPVDSEGDPLRLPLPLSEYLVGTVPASMAPTAWPDPLFSATQAMSLWPTKGSDQVPEPDTSGVAEIETEREKRGWPQGGKSFPAEGTEPQPDSVAHMRKRGRPPRKTLETQQRMTIAYAGHETHLFEATEESLKAEFGVSRTTIRAARNALREDCTKFAD